jgi:hypothetical protein
MARPTLSALTLLALAVASAAPAQAIRLRYKFRRGEVSTYRTLVAAAGQSETPLVAEPLRMQMRVDVISTQRVLSVSSNGTAQIESRNVSGTNRVMSMGKTQSSKAQPETTVYTLTDRGRVLRYRETPPPRQGGAAATADGDAEGASFPESDPLKALYGLNFPEKDLQPGESWSTSSEVEIARGRSVVIKIRSTFAGLVSHRGRRCAKILTAFEMPTETQQEGTGGPAPPDTGGPSVSQEGRVTGRLTSFFDIAEGREIDTDGWVAMLMKMKMTAPSASSGGMESAEMNSVLKMNLRQVFLKVVAPGQPRAAGAGRP